MFTKILRMVAAAVLGSAAFVIPALAQDGRVGMAHEKQIKFQSPATEVMQDIVWLHDVIMVIISLIVLLILLLLVWIMVRYNHRSNPTPSKTTHNTLLEIIWTIIPVIILVYVGYYSVKLLYKEDVIPEAGMVVQVTGHQWNWTYEYPDYNNLTFEGYMVPSDYLAGTASATETDDWDQRMEELRVLLGRTEPLKLHRLLDTDTRMVVPVNTTVKVLVTADDVIHSWTIPAFGFKMDAVPGRVNETWFNAYEIGTYYGQCSELCGIGHAFMPIVVEVVSQEDFDAWVTRATAFYASGQLLEGSQVADRDQ